MVATVYSVYMSNIEKAVVEAQSEVVSRLLPDGWIFEQVLHQPKSGEGFFHATALEKCYDSNKNPITIFLDIDCIPLSTSALPTLAKEAESGILSGAVQRANHIRNDAHLYVGPFCMAFLNSQYKKFGSPSFKETDRGDCAEELTYRWEQEGGGIHMLWPNHTYRPAWALTEGVSFGYGTTYENLFYHAFAIRQSFMQEQFISKCQEVLAANYPKKVVPKVEKVEKVEVKKEEPIKVEEPKEPKQESKKIDAPKKAIPTSEEIKPREIKKEAVATKGESKPTKERVAI